MQDKPPLKLLSLEEAAQTLGVDYRTVYRLVHRGELPAARVGRVYRIRQGDLEAFFERNLVADSSRTTDKVSTPKSQTCSACNRELLSTLSIAGRCDVCGKPLCAACWSVKKLRHCTPHSSAENSPDLTPPVAEPPEITFEQKETPSVPVEWKATPPTKVPETPPNENTGYGQLDKRLDDLRSQGRPVVTYGEAITLQDQFIRSFVQRVEWLETVIAAHTGHEIDLRKAKVRAVEPNPKNPLDNQLEINFMQFVIRTGGWRSPLQSVVLEARALAHFDRLRKQKYDDTLLDAAEISKEFDALRNDKKKKPYRDAFRVVVFGCFPGVDAAAASLVTTPQMIGGFTDKQVMVALWDSKTGDVFYASDDERVWPYLPLIDPKRWQETIDDALGQVSDLLNARKSLTADDAVGRLKINRHVIMAAFRKLAEQGILLDEVDDIGWVLSIGRT